MLAEHKGLQYAEALMVTLESDWKESVRRALSRAQRDGMTLVSIAEKLNMKPQSLSNFGSMGKLGANKVRVLEDWLRERGYYADANSAREDEVGYGVKMQTCPHCGDDTPVQIDGKTLVYCENCGELLGTPCPKCGTLETREDAAFCRACAHPLTQDAAKLFEP